MSQSPADLLRQISSFNAEKQGEAVRMIPRPAESKKTDLIQVISTADAQPQEPRYRLQLKADAAGAPRSMELTVELPMVSSVSECQLRISKVSASTLLWTILMSQFRIQSVRIRQHLGKKSVGCLCVFLWRMTSCWRWRLSTTYGWISQHMSTKTRHLPSLTRRNGRSP